MVLMIFIEQIDSCNESFRKDWECKIVKYCNTWGSFQVCHSGLNLNFQFGGMFQLTSCWAKSASWGVSIRSTVVDVYLEPSGNVDVEWRPHEFLGRPQSKCFIFMANSQPNMGSEAELKTLALFFYLWCQQELKRENSARYPRACHMSMFYMSDPSCVHNRCNHFLDQEVDVVMNHDHFYFPICMVTCFCPWTYFRLQAAETAKLWRGREDDWDPVMVSHL